MKRKTVIQIGNQKIPFEKELRNRDVKAAISLFRSRSVYAVVIGDYVVVKGCSINSDIVFYKIEIEKEFNPTKSKIVNKYSYREAYVVSLSMEESNKVPDKIKDAVSSRPRDNEGFINFRLKPSKKCGKILKSFRKKFLNFEENAEEKYSGSSENNTPESKKIERQQISVPFRHFFVPFDMIYRGEAELLNEFLVDRRYKAIVISKYIFCWETNLDSYPFVSCYTYKESYGSAYVFEKVFELSEDFVNTDDFSDTIDTLGIFEYDDENPYRGLIYKSGISTGYSAEMLLDFKKKNNI